MPAFHHLFLRNVLPALLLVVALFTFSATTTAQEFTRLRADFTIQKTGSNSAQSLTKGTVYYDRTLKRIVDETLDANDMEKSDIDWLVPHQANIRIIEATAKQLNMGMDKVVVTVDRHGNTSAASVPLAPDTAVRDGRP